MNVNIHGTGDERMRWEAGVVSFESEYRRVLVSAALLVLPSLACAQDPASTKARLIPGDADVIHDILGIQIGMPCREAAARGIQLSHVPIFNGVLINYEQRDTGKIDGRTVDYTYHSYEFVYAHIVANNTDTTYDTVKFSCIETENESQVFQISRNINYQSNYIWKILTPPSIASVYQMFQEKYGVPTVAYSPLVLTALFNRKGAITTKENGCISYMNGGIYPNSLEFNADKCSYQLVFHVTEARDRPGATDFIEISIRDHLRLELAIRENEKHRLETAPAAVPKL